MTFLTDIVDQAVVLPLVVVVAVVLAAIGHWRGAMVWSLAVGATFAVMLTLKIGSLACRPVLAAWSIWSPSGHTAAAAMVAGGLAALMTGRRRIAVPIAVGAAAVIGVTRVGLGFHTVPEVLIGGLTGCLGVILMTKWLDQPPPRRPFPVLTAAVLVVVLLHGTRLQAEAAIWHVSKGALRFIPACDFPERGRR